MKKKVFLIVVIIIICILALGYYLIKQNEEKWLVCISFHDPNVVDMVTSTNYYIYKKENGNGYIYTNDSGYTNMKGEYIDSGEETVVGEINKKEEIAEIFGESNESSIGGMVFRKRTIILSDGRTLNSTRSLEKYLFGE